MNLQLCQEVNKSFSQKDSTGAILPLEKLENNILGGRPDKYTNRDSYIFFHFPA
jgi:hypothetical protein